MYTPFMLFTSLMTMSPLASSNTMLAGPVANDDRARIQCETITPIDVLANDFDPDGDPLTIISATTNGGNVTNEGPDLTFDSPQPGTFVIQYTISDGNGGTANAIATVTVVNGPNCV
jgi:hypothetical protein